MKSLMKKTLLMLFLGGVFWNSSIFYGMVAEQWLSRYIDQQSIKAIHMDRAARGCAGYAKTNRD